MQQLTKEQAIAVYESGAWEIWTDEEIVKFQLFQERLCMPFTRFHRAIEKVLGRPVWTHEFAFLDSLIAEYNRERPVPSFEDIINLIPKERFIVMTSDDPSE